MNCFRLIIISISLILLEGQVFSQDCFSCDIPVDSLDDSLDLSGHWKFSKDDRLENKDPSTSVEDWPTVMTPGGWDKVYPDSDPFMVGWYRGNLNFDKKLLGQRVTLLLDAYMSAVTVYLDGEEIYRRGGRDANGKYYSIQPIPINFEISKDSHTIAFRIETNLMKGVYQLPFSLNAYSKSNGFLAFAHFWGGEFRLLAGFITAAFGLFFLLVYVRIRAKIYLIAALSGLAIFPFYGLPSDMLIRFFDPLTLQMLHYTGIGSLAMFHGYFAQFFYKFYPKFNRFNFIVNGVLISLFIYFIFDFHHSGFLTTRKILFLYANLVSYQFIYVLFRAVKKNKLAITLLLGEFFMFVCSIHDILLALGVIQSISLLFFGTLVATAAIMIVASSIFASTYLENKTLLSNIEGVNKNLESIVKARTSELEVKSREMNAMAEKQTSAIHETVGTLSEITEITNKNVKSIEQSTEEADISHDMVIEGRTAVEEMRASMEEIENTVQAMVKQVEEGNAGMEVITKIIHDISNRASVINDIVFQTKLLSFNASVEAARAGDQGKGFSVVAEEVGNLAQMSGEAAKDISALLGQSKDQVDAIVEKSKRELEKLATLSAEKVVVGVELANRCDKSLSDILEHVDAVKDLMTEISSSAKQQAGSVDSIALAMKNLEEASHQSTKKKSVA